MVSLWRTEEASRFARDDDICFTARVVSSSNGYNTASANQLTGTHRLQPDGAVTRFEFAQQQQPVLQPDATQHGRNLRPLEVFQHVCGTDCCARAWNPSPFLVRRVHRRASRRRRIHGGEPFLQHVSCAMI